LEFRRPPAGGRPSAWRRFVEAGGPLSVLLAMILFVGLVALDAWPRRAGPLRVGQYIPQDIYARMSFEVPAPALLEEQIQQANNSTPATFKLNTALVDQIMEDLSRLPAVVAAATRPADLPEDVQKQFQLTEQAALAAWRTTTQPVQQRAYQEQLQSLRSQLVQTGIVRAEEKAPQLQRNVTQAWLEHPQGRKLAHVLYELVGLDEQEELSLKVNSITRGVQASLRPQVQHYLLGLFANNQPLYRYDHEASQRDINQRVQEIQADPPRELHQAGELLARSSRRPGPEGPQAAGLSEAERRLLLREQQAYLEHLRANEPWRGRLELTGRAGLLGLLTVLLCLQVLRYQPALVKDPWRGLALLVLLLTAMVLGKVMVFLLEWNSTGIVLPVMMGAVTIAIAFDQRLAFAAGAVVALLAALLIRSDLPMVLVLLGVIATAVFSLGEVRTRGKLVKVSGASAAVAFALVVAAGLARGAPWHFILLDGAWGAGFAALAGFIIQGVLPVIERAFRVATSITLLEWCDASKPLLKRLAMEAPGTYNHSLLLGTLCETAAEAIGARGLLARVGAYYHDIGKINKPDYFVENQSGITSRHARLSPAMSMLVIIGHVKDGLELARQYGLPPVLHEFIATHHGTTLLQYFYHAAIEGRKKASERRPDELEFRYPGPKPWTKEAAILLLADAAESSVRSMVEPTAGRIENQVHTMVTRRLMDGQLDQCDLTFREVYKIEASLIKSLMGIYHARIAYPRPAGQQASAAEREAEQRQAQQRPAPPPLAPTPPAQPSQPVPPAAGPSSPGQPTPDAPDRQTRPSG